MARVALVLSPLDSVWTGAGEWQRQEVMALDGEASDVITHKQTVTRSHTHTHATELSGVKRLFPIPSHQIFLSIGVLYLSRGSCECDIVYALQQDLWPYIYVWEAVYLSSAKIGYRWNILDFFFIDGVCGLQNSVEFEHKKMKRCTFWHSWWKWKIGIKMILINFVILINVTIFAINLKWMFL